MSEISSTDSEDNPSETQTHTDGTPQLTSDEVLRFIKDEQIKAEIKADKAAQEADKRQINTLNAIHSQSRISILIAAIVAFCTIGQLIITYINNNDTSNQTGRIIRAAEMNTHLAGHNVAAAQSFANSAERINQGVVEAVGQLNLQAQHFADSTEQMRRLANITKEANDNINNVDRSWLGLSAVVTDFQVGRHPTVRIDITNSGRHASRIEKNSFAFGSGPTFPFDPDALLAQKPLSDHAGVGKVVLVPGQPFHKQGTAADELFQSQMDSVSRGELIYVALGKVEYIDLITKQPHVTKICIVHVPHSLDTTNFGFVNCDTYNDAD